MKKKCPAVITAFFLIALTMKLTFVSLAEEQDFQRNDGEVVILFDTSGSMNTQDKNRLAVDAIRQAIYSLPSNYQAGVVAYNTGIQAIIPFHTQLNQMDTQLAAIAYGGYTNAGEGLNQALALFSDREQVDRTVIMLTDGEIDMPEAQAREVSRALYADAAARAKEKGVKIYIVAVGSELNDPQMHIFSGAEMTDGAIYWDGQSGSLSRIIDRIITDRLSVPRQAAGVTDSGGGNVHVEVPPGVERFKLLVTGEAGLRNVRADYAAESEQTIAGQRFAVVDMRRPSSESVDLYFETADLSGVRACLLTEFSVEPQITVKYRSEELSRTEEEIKKDVPPEYEHWADVAISLVDAGGKHENLWLQEPYDGWEISYRLNGVSLTGRIENGQLRTTIPADGVDVAEVSVDTKGMEGIYHVNQPVSAKIEKYPDPVYEPAPDYRPLLGVLGALLAALALILAQWIRKKNATVIYVAQPQASREPAKKMETRTCAYSGKFNMYVVRTADGRDVPPQTYRLFGRCCGRMTLNQVLNSCKIKFGRIGAEDIIFYPGPEHSVIIMDQSERCTVLRGTEILKKGIGYPVFYGEKVTIAFEDESTEMEIHYKNLKPSEREER